MWKDPVATEGVTEACCDGSTETLCIPLKACFEGEEHVPSMLRVSICDRPCPNGKVLACSGLTCVTRANGGKSILSTFGSVAF